MEDLLHRLEAAELACAGLTTRIRADLVRATLANRVEAIEQIRDMLPSVIILETVLKGIQTDMDAALREARTVKDREIPEKTEKEISEKVADELAGVLDGLIRILAQDRLIDESMIDLSHLPAATRQRLSKDLKISI